MLDFHRISAEAQDHTENLQNAAIPADLLVLPLVQGGLRVDLQSLEPIVESELGSMQYRFHLQLAELIARDQC